MNVNFVINDTEKPLAEEEMSTFESEFSKALPDSFKIYYLLHNGGFPEADYVRGEKNIFSIDGFIPIKYGLLPIERLIKDMLGPAPKGLYVPFANDSGGNIFYISLADNDYGQVYLVTAETSENIYVCSSFDEFLAGLF